MRPSLIAAVVPTNTKTIGQVYRSIMGRSPPSGQPPTNSLHYIRKKDEYAALGALMAISYLRQRTDHTVRSICPDTLCLTTDFIRANVSRSDIYHPLLSSGIQPTASGVPAISGTLIEMLYFIVRDITIKQADIVKCTNPSCGRPYIWHNLAPVTSTTTEPCPWCRLSRKHDGVSRKSSSAAADLASDLSSVEHDQTQQMVANG